jgi:tetratricopeptide (TPR) repeat protein
VVDLLPVDDAAELLASLTGVALRADRTAAVRLAERCARLPLALRLAAEYLIAHPGLTPEKLAADLDDEQQRLNLLEAGGAQYTAIRAVFSWSYIGLPPAAARAFCLLGLNPGPDIDRAAAGALLDTDLAEAHRLLEILSRSHLVSESAPGRFGMHELLRAYARERIADRDETTRATLGRLFEYYLTMTAAAMDAVAPHERHQWSGDVPGKLGPPAEPVDWLDANRPNLVAMAAAGAERWPHYVLTLSQIIWRYLESGGHRADAETLDRHALSAAIALGDRVAEARTRRHLAVIAGRHGRYEEAASQARLALKLATAAGDRFGEASALNNLGAFTTQIGRYEEALVHLSRAYALCAEVGESGGRAVVAGNIAELYEKQKRYDAAVEWAHRALALMDEIGDRSGAGRVTSQLGRVHLELGRFGEAIGYFRRSLAFLRERGSYAYEGQTLGKLADVHLRLGRHREALAYSRRALAASRSVGDAETEAAVLAILAAATDARAAP